MKLFTQTEHDQLIENGKPKNHAKDHYPVVKFFIQETGASFVLTELRSEKPLVAYGLWNIGNECKLSHIYLDKIIEFAKEYGSELKKVENFKAKSPISVFVNAAKRRHTTSLMKEMLLYQSERKVN